MGEGEERKHEEPVGWLVAAKRKEVESLPDPSNRFIFEAERYRDKEQWKHAAGSWRG